jgi:hypothetical protein
VNHESVHSSGYTVFAIVERNKELVKHCANYHMGYMAIHSESVGPYALDTKVAHRYSSGIRIELIPSSLPTCTDFYVRIVMKTGTSFQPFAHNTANDIAARSQETTFGQSTTLFSSKKLLISFIERSRSDRRSGLESGCRTRILSCSDFVTRS